ncbi:MAG: NAD(P)H-dependent oxidoreductase [Candidatus Gracilibacteria bacterium]|nr:NAD(P)H-dependent oxidoreductase [Candidatus Gracilibacteria bacterium]MDQ7023731.1 NAD(P)H-dependent oxidoreductase [Candidatus Gracilibacteria bacterium]
MTKITIVQSSLRENSNTSIVCELFKQKAISAGIEVNYIDLRNIELEFCNGKDLSEYNKDLQNSFKMMEESESIIFGMPVYQYSMSGVLKNFIDICGGALVSKKIGVIVNAGGPNCYMASRDLLDALYYEYGTTNIAPTPYSWSMDFKDGELVNKKVMEKLDELVENIK